MSLSSNLSSQLRTLNDIVRECRRIFLDMQPRIQVIEDETQTPLLPLWKAIYQEYKRIIDDSETDVTRLSATLKAYLALQGGLRGSTAIDALSVELQAFNKRVPELNADHLTPFTNLKISVDSFDRAFGIAISGRGGLPRKETERTPVEMTVCEQPLKGSRGKGSRKEIDNQANEYPRGLFSVVAHVSNRSGTPPPIGSVHEGILGGARPDEQALQSNFGGTQARLSGAASTPQNHEVDQIVAERIQVLRKNLQIQSELLTAVFSGVRNELRSEIENYLTAASNAKVNPSPATQLALRNATERMASSSGMWKERASVLMNEYAKTTK